MYYNLCLDIWLCSFIIMQCLIGLGDAFCAFSPDSDGHVEIPMGLSSVDYRSFYECSELVSVTIPGSVRSIDERAFAYCENL